MPKKSDLTRRRQILKILSAAPLLCGSTGRTQVGSRATKATASRLTRVHTARATKAREKLGIPADHHAVLSIDGGGVRGFIPLAILERFESTYQVPAYEVFDVVVGTSTGAIIGSLVAAGVEARTIRQLYRDEIHKIFELSRDGEPAEPFANSYIYHRDIPGKYGNTGSMRAKFKTVADNIAAIRMSLTQDDRQMRLLGGSPVYKKDYVRQLLQSRFLQLGCATLGDLARKNQCIVAFTAVDASSGSSVLMSASGDIGKGFGSCENCKTAACIEASMSAPLYFNPYGGELLDGGTLSTNMPLLSALQHLESRANPAEAIPRGSIGIAEYGRSLTREHFEKPLSRQGTQAPVEFEDVPSLAPKVEDELLFDMHKTSIFSLGCGIGPMKPWSKAALDISKPQRHYQQKRWPYGELSKLIEIARDIPTDISDAGYVYPTVSNAKDFWANMQETLKTHSRFGIGATVNTLAFLKDGLARDAWDVQQRLFRSRLFKGQFRRFQLSLDMDMQTKSIWRFHPRYDEREKLAREDPRYGFPVKITRGNGQEIIRDDRYDLISIWTELERNDMADFVPGLEPLGTIALKWLDCIGERFAHAIEEFCNSRGSAFMGIDLADHWGGDVFVSPECVNEVSRKRWIEIRKVLGA